jgi:hypothetical protein
LVSGGSVDRREGGRSIYWSIYWREEERQHHREMSSREEEEEESVFVFLFFRSKNKHAAKTNTQML